MRRTRWRSHKGDGSSVGSALMFRFDADLQIYLHREPIDFPAGIISLVTLVEQS